LLKCTWDTDHKDFLDLFVPLTATVLANTEAPNHEFQTDDVCSRFSATFGLNVPHHAMITILNRCQRLGIFRREDGHTYVIPEKAQAYSVARKAALQERDQNELVEAFAAFAKERFGLQLPLPEAQAALVKFLSSSEAETLCMSNGSQHSVILVPSEQTRSGLSYAISCFIQSIQSENPRLFSYLINAYIGALLVSVVTWMGFATPSKHLLNLTVYLDTRIVLGAIGAQGEQDKQSCRDLLALLRGQGARLALFDHLRAEVDWALADCSDWISHPAYDPMKASRALRHLRSEGKTQSDVIELIANVNTMLAELDVFVTDEPHLDVADIPHIDQKTLHDAIVTRYAQGRLTPPNFDLTIQDRSVWRDVESVDKVQCLRQGHSPSFSLGQVPAILVTGNSSLATTVKQFELNQYGTSAGLPLCVTDVFLGTLAWLGAPTRSEEVSTSHLMAQCQAAMLPSDALISRFLERLRAARDAGRIDDQQYLVLRSTQVALRMLQDETLGNPDAVDDSTPEDVLHRILDENREDYKRRMEANSRQTTEQIKEADQRTASTKALLDSFDSHLQKATSFFSFLIAFAWYALCVLPLAWPLMPTTVTGSLPPLVLKLFTVAGLVFQLLNMSGGLTFVGLKQRIDKSLHASLFNRLTR
jgi:hypothetical protein